MLLLSLSAFLRLRVKIKTSLSRNTPTHQSNYHTTNYPPSSILYPLLTNDAPA